MNRICRSIGRIHRPRVSFILATHNRAAVLAETLAQIRACGLDRADREIIVVDNASTDGATAIAREFADRVIALDRNHGSCAKALAVPQARGEFLVFVDDDSHPRPGHVERMIAHFDSKPRLGAAGFTVVLPNGAMEGAALPDVFVGCGVGFRADVLRRAGGLDASFFMQAEEYDLAFRIAQSGWDVRVFDDIVVEHMKTPHARRTERTTFFDMRNNLRVIARYVPQPAAGVVLADAMQRYRWLAEGEGHLSAWRRGGRIGRWLGSRERDSGRYRVLGPRVFERFFCWRMIGERMAALSRGGVRTVVLADLGKNVFPFVASARAAGLRVAAIGDDRFAAPGRRYRGVEIVPLAEAIEHRADAVVISNTAPVHADRTARRLAELTDRPVEHWFPCAVQRDSSNCAVPRDSSNRSTDHRALVDEHRRGTADAAVAHGKPRGA